MNRFTFGVATLVLATLLCRPSSVSAFTPTGAIAIIRHGRTSSSASNQHRFDPPSAFPQSSSRPDMALHARKAASAAAQSHILHGKVTAVLSKLFLTPVATLNVFRQVFLHIQWVELLAVAMCVAAPLPVAKWTFIRRMQARERRVKLQERAKQVTNTTADLIAHYATADTSGAPKSFMLTKESEDPDEADDDDAFDFDFDKAEALFQTSNSRKAALIIRQIGLLQAVLYTIDVFVLTLKLFGFKAAANNSIQKWAATVVVSMWCARNLSVMKWHYIMHNAQKVRRMTQRRRFPLSRVMTKGKAASKGDDGLLLPQKLGFSNRLLNRGIDVFLYACAVVLIIDILPFEMGIAVKSLFGLSGVGTLVFSLASKDFASQCLASLAIESSNLFEEGDEVLLYDGTQGIVHKMGWMHTHIRRGDELIVRIPNSQIANNRVANVSRIRLCQVKQSIAVRYEDIDKVKQLSEDIKQGIREKCGKLLIDGGGRAFRVHWREYQLYYIEIVVDAHFRTRPSGTEYWDLRENVLQAIYEATKKNNVRFSYTNFIGSDTPLLTDTTI